MRILSAAIAFILLASPAYAQNREREKSSHEILDEQRQRERADIQKEYDATMRRLKSQNSGASGPADPWRSIRPAGKPTPNR